MATVVIADDDAHFAELLKDFLSVNGYQVETVRDGGQLEALMKAGGFNAAILDMQMPMGGGIAAARRIRTYFNNITIPIIVCSGMPVEMSQKWFEGMSKLSVFQKPPDYGVLLAELGRLLNEP